MADNDDSLTTPLCSGHTTVSENGDISIGIIQLARSWKGECYNADERNTTHKRPVIICIPRV